MPVLITAGVTCVRDGIAVHGDERVGLHRRFGRRRNGGGGAQDAKRCKRRHPWSEVGDREFPTAPTLEVRRWTSCSQSISELFESSHQFSEDAAQAFRGRGRTDKRRARTIPNDVRPLIACLSQIGPDGE